MTHQVSSFASHGDLFYWSSMLDIPPGADREAFVMRHPDLGQTCGIRVLRWERLALTGDGVHVLYILQDLCRGARLAA